jgi:hypothetical protein
MSGKKRRTIETSVIITDACFKRLKRTGRERLETASGDVVWIHYHAKLKIKRQPGIRGKGCYIVDNEADQ